MNRASFAASTAAVVMSAPRIARAQTPPRPIRIGAIAFDNAAEVFYAQDQAFFEKAGLNVEITALGSGGAITAAVASGALDIGFSNLFSVITAYGRGIPVVAIVPATMQATGSPTAGLIVLKSAPFHSGKDLNGKIVGVDGLKGITQISTQAWVDKNGGDSSTLKFVEVPEPAIGEALKQGRIDAGTLQLTNVDLTPQSAVRMLADPYTAIAPRFFPSVWFTTRTWLAGHRDDARRFANVMRQTARWANANHAASAEILMKIAKLTPERMLALSAHRAPYGEALDPRMVQSVIDVAAHYGLIASAFPSQEIVDTLR